MLQVREILTIQMFMIYSQNFGQKILFLQEKIGDVISNVSEI